MPWKDKEKQRAAIRKHYYANRQMYIDKAKARKLKLRQWLRDFKEANYCSNCKTTYPYYVMDFDHIGYKQVEIASLVNKSSNFSQIRLEITQCEVVCSNCHRKRTHKRLNTI